jgi:hypothetical protein
MGDESAQPDSRESCNIGGLGGGAGPEEMEGEAKKKVNHTCQESTSGRMRVRRITQNYVEL